MPYTLAYKDRFKRVLDSYMEIGSSDPILQFPTIHETQNEARYIWTAQEWLRLNSVVRLGADLMYPDDAGTIWWSLLRGIHQPTPFPDETGKCYTYPPYAPFVSYEPSSPFEPSGFSPIYPVAPFFLWSARGTIFPDWLAEFFLGVLGWATGYQDNDVLVSFLSQPLIQNPFDGLDYPQIQIKVSGSGIARINLLQLPAGGRALITVDNPPDIGDLFSYIFDETDRVVELDRDLVSFPPETDIISSEEVEVTGAGLHTIYVTFIPVLNDTGLFIQFGGGFRDVELCGFDDLGVIMGITDLRINANCEIETFENGIWSVKGAINPCVTAITNPMQTQINQNTTDIIITESDIQALYLENDNQQSDIDALILDVTQKTLDIQANADAVVVAQSTADLAYNLIQTSINPYIQDHETRIFALESASPNVSGNSGQNIIATAFTFETGANLDASGSAWSPMIAVNHVFTYPNALIHMEFKMSSGASAPIAKGRLRLETNEIPIQDVAIGDNEAWVKGTTQISTELNNVFSALPAANLGLVLDMASSSGGSYARLWGGQQIQFSIIEFSSPALPQFLVDFDGGYAYALPLSQDGIVTATGNTGNALQSQNLPSGNHMEVEWDLGAIQDIADVKLDWYAETAFSSTQQILLYVDDVLKYTYTINFGVTGSSQWHTLNFSSFAVFPMSGQLVRVRFLNNHPTGTQADVRFDNLEAIV